MQKYTHRQTHIHKHTHTHTHTYTHTHTWKHKNTYTDFNSCPILYILYTLYDLYSIYSMFAFLTNSNMKIFMCNTYPCIISNTQHVQSLRYRTLRLFACTYCFSLLFGNRPPVFVHLE